MDVRARLTLAVSLTLSLLGLAFSVTGFQNRTLGLFFFALAAVTLLAGFWPWLRRVRLRSPLTVSPGRESVSLNPATNAPTSQLPNESSNLQAEITKLRDDLDTARDAIKDREKWGTEWFQKVHFGEVLEDNFGALQPEDFKRMSDNVRELIPSMRATATGLDHVWANLAARIRALPDLPWKILGWRLDRLEEVERSHVRHILGSLEKRLDNKEDPRPALAGFYRCYRRWRHQVVEVADIAGQPIRFIIGSIEWMDAERRFFDDFVKKLATSGLRGVKRLVDAYNMQNGPPADLSQ